MVPLEERDHQREPQHNEREVTINLFETTSFYSRTTTFDSQASFQNNDIGLEALPTFLLPLSLAFAFSISLSLSSLSPPAIALEFDGISLENRLLSSFGLILSIEPSVLLLDRPICVSIHTYLYTYIIDDGGLCKQRRRILLFGSRLVRRARK